MDKIFKYTAFFLIFMGILIIFTPTINVNELLYPVRVDSAYVKLQQKVFMKNSEVDSTGNSDLFYFNPGQYDLNYRRLEVHTCDNLLLKGWFIMNESSAPTLIIIPDLNESKISFLKAAREFHDRGFNVVLMDMRAQGESEGIMQTFGTKEYEDLISVMDSVYKYVDNRHIAVFGKGLGANIALNAAFHDKRIGCVIAQSAFNNTEEYIHRYARSKYGKLTNTFYPLMRRQMRHLMPLSIDSLAYDSMMTKLSVPTLMLAATDDRVVPVSDSYRLYTLLKIRNKNFFQVRGAGHDNMDDVVGSDYYEQIAVFIAGAFPKPPVRSRFRNSV